MKSEQRGSGTVSSLVLVALGIALLLMMVRDNSPAKPEDLQGVISLASINPEANAALAAALLETPNPSRADLDGMRDRVNEIVVTEIAKEVTGETTLQTPSVARATRELHQAQYLAALESKAWAEMSNQERIDFLGSKTHVLVSLGLLIAFLWGTAFFLKVVKRNERGY